MFQLLRSLISFDIVFLFWVIFFFYNLFEKILNFINIYVKGKINIKNFDLIVKMLKDINIMNEISNIKSSWSILKYSFIFKFNEL